MQAGHLQDDEIAVAEMRVRLLAGLKRYLHGKRLNGLLSSQVLCYVGEPLMIMAVLGAVSCLFWLLDLLAPEGGLQVECILQASAANHIGLRSNMCSCERLHLKMRHGLSDDQVYLFCILRL